MWMSREATWKEPVTSQRELTQKRAKSYSDTSQGMPFGLFVELSLQSHRNAAQPTQGAARLRTDAVEAAQSGAQALRGRLQNTLAQTPPNARQAGLAATVSGGGVQPDRQKSVGGRSGHEVEGEAPMQAVVQSHAQESVAADAHVLRVNRSQMHAVQLPSAQLPTPNEGHNAVNAQDSGGVVQVPHLLTREGGQALGKGNSPRFGVADATFAGGSDVTQADATGGTVFADQSAPGHGQVGLATRPEVSWFTQAAQVLPPASTVSGAAQPVVHLTQAQAPTQLGQFVLQQVQTGPGEMRVKVHPEGMGDIVVAVFRSGDSIHVRLEANHAQTVHWLTQHADALVQAVKTSGVDLASVEVAFGSASLSQGFQDDASSSRRQREGASQRDTGWMQSHRTETGSRFLAFDYGGLESRVNLQV